jgi:hypothetical protein
MQKAIKINLQDKRIMLKEIKIVYLVKQTLQKVIKTHYLVIAIKLKAEMQIIFQE